MLLEALPPTLKSRLPTDSVAPPATRGSSDESISREAGWVRGVLCIRRLLSSVKADRLGWEGSTLPRLRSWLGDRKSAQPGPRENERAGDRGAKRFVGRLNVDRDPAAWAAARRHLLEWIEAGELAISVSRRFPLEEAAEARRLLESRASIGKVVLMPAGSEERRPDTHTL